MLFLRYFPLFKEVDALVAKKNYLVGKIKESENRINNNRIRKAKLMELAEGLRHCKILCNDVDKRLAEQRDVLSQINDLSLNIKSLQSSLEKSTSESQNLNKKFNSLQENYDRMEQKYIVNKNLFQKNLDDMSIQNARLLKHKHEVTLQVQERLKVLKDNEAKVCITLY